MAVPNTPGGFGLAFNNAQVGAVFLKNTSGGAPTGYRLKRATVSGGPYTTIADGISPPFANFPLALTFVDTGRTNGAIYYYIATAYNGDGESAPTAELNATPLNTVDNSVFAGQDVPAQVEAGSQFSVTLRFVNTGTSTWRASNDYDLRFPPGGPDDDLTWGLHRLRLLYDTPPGYEGAFSGVLTAPSTPGAYTFQWDCFQDVTGIEFGADSPLIDLVVAPDAPLLTGFGFTVNGVPGNSLGWT